MEDHDLASHLHSTSWKVSFTALPTLLLPKTGVRPTPGCSSYRFIIGLVLSTQIHQVLVPILSGNLPVSESLESVIKVRSLLDEHRISAESGVLKRYFHQACWICLPNRKYALSFRLPSLLDHAGYFLSNASFRLLTSTRSSFHPGVPPFNI